jgi:hypothetical protein
MITHTKSTYQAYLIRCWYEGDKWHFTLETIGPERQQRAFNTLPALMVYVQALLDESSQ